MLNDICKEHKVSRDFAASTERDKNRLSFGLHIRRMPLYQPTW